MNKPMRVRRMTIETERTYIFRSRGDRQATWCPACGAEVEMACVETAARDAGLSELAIYQLIESGTLHFTEGENKRVLVCLNYLKQ